MASVLPRARVSNVVAFVTRSGLGATPPTAPPPSPKKFGSYCFRATCSIDDAKGCRVAKIKGFDQSPSIGKETEEYCRIHVRTMDGQYSCGAAQVVMLPHSEMECTGQMVFVMDGEVRRLL